MKEWLRERPWIWIIVLMVLLFVASAATLIIAELNRPELVNQSRLQPGAMLFSARV